MVELISKVGVTLVLLALAAFADMGPELQNIIIGATVGYWLREGERQTALTIVNGAERRAERERANGDPD